MQVNSTTSQSGYGDTYTESVQKNDAMGKDAFLELLVNQLRNQDPLNPVNDRDFLAQMAQFSSLEQMQNLNKNFETGFNNLMEAVDVGLYENFQALVSINSNLVMQQNLQAMNMLGMNVTAVIEGEEETRTIEGTVERVAFKDGRVQMEVDGELIYMDEVTHFEMRNIQPEPEPEPEQQAE